MVEISSLLFLISTNFTVNITANNIKIAINAIIIVIFLVVILLIKLNVTGKNNYYFFSQEHILY